MQFILNGILSYNFSFFCCSLLDTSVSGSPILQDGKIVGAVTQVFVQDSTKGYGILCLEAYSDVWCENIRMKGGKYRTNV